MAQVKSEIQITIRAELAETETDDLIEILSAYSDGMSAKTTSTVKAQFAKKLADDLHSELVKSFDTRDQINKAQAAIA